MWGVPSWRVERLVSYDLMIDEKWTGSTRRKERWSVREADQAVAVTMEAAVLLASRRASLEPRGLVLACQGVNCRQYSDCCQAVRRHAAPPSWDRRWIRC
jgi:hypothetical protein